jgi:hypothetical protein
MSLLEDQVIGVYADHQRNAGVLVLAEGGNQMRAFRFMTSTKRRKAPDLALYCDGVLSIFEAKVRPADLFRLGNDGLSDYAAMREISESPEIQKQFIAEASRRLRACGYSGPPPTTVHLGLIAAGPILKHLPKVSPSPLLLINVSVESKSWVIETQ